MNREEKAVKDGLNQVLNEMKQQQKVSDLNRGYNTGVGQGKIIFLIVALIGTMITCAIVVTATLITVGEVDGRSQAQSQYHQQQQKVIIDQISLMMVKHEKLLHQHEKLKNEVNNK
jgi:hypothetical protein